MYHFKCQVAHTIAADQRIAAVRTIVRHTEADLHIVIVRRIEAVERIAAVDHTLVDSKQHCAAGTK